MGGRTRHSKNGSKNRAKKKDFRKGIATKKRAKDIDQIQVSDPLGWHA